MDLKELKRRLDYEESNRSVWKAHCQEIVDHIAPDRQSFTRRRMEGEKTMGQIYDPTAMYASERFQRGVFDLMCNPATRWFGVSSEDSKAMENRDNKLFLDAVEKFFYTVLNKSNFYSEVQAAIKDWADFGEACQFLGAAPRTGAYFDNVPLGDAYPSEGRPGIIDTIYRRMRWTARQIMREWPERASPKVKNAYKDNPEEKFEVIHAVLPRQDLPVAGNVAPFFNPQKRSNKEMPFASVYFEVSELQLLSDSGFREFPFMAPRMNRAPGEKTGRGLGMIALPSAKGLNRMKYDILRAGAKRVDPPMLFSNDSMINPLRRNPEAVNIMRTDTVKDKYAFLISPHDPNYEQWLLQDDRQMIKQIYFNDLLEMLEMPGRTAFEVGKLIERKMRLMGGSFGQWTSGYFNPMFDRLFNLGLEGGYLPRPPESMWGADLKIDYYSPLAMAQKAAANEGITQAAGFVGQVMSFYPGIIDIADWDEAGRDYLENSSFPTKAILPPEQVNQTRQAKAKQQQAQQAAAMALEAAKTMPALAKGPEPGSPMDQISQQLQQGAGNASNV